MSYELGAKGSCNLCFITIMKGKKNMNDLWENCRDRKIRDFNIEAIQLPIVYNKYGDHDPKGL